MLIGQDGWYYVTLPYHESGRTLLFKHVINYASSENHLTLEDAQELGLLKDDDARLKFAHHPDGFLQFSGTGVLSGRHPLTGEPKGLGTFRGRCYGTGGRTIIRRLHSRR